MATTSTFDNVQFFDSDLESNWSNRAKEHLWMHFSRMGAYETGGSIPVIVKGEGHIFTMTVASVILMAFISLYHSSGSWSRGVG